MKEPVDNHKSYRPYVLVVAAAVLVTGSAVLNILPTARSRATISITINNNSQKEIRHLYLAAGNPNNWGPDQLNGSTISPGTSYTLSNVPCDGSNIRVIAEDQNGCFLYNTVSCDSNSTWNISDSTTADCGG